MISAIQTRRHWIRRLTFEPSESTVPEPKYHARISLRHAKTDGCWHVWLKVAIGPKMPEPANFSAEVEFEGLFDVRPDFPEDKVNDLVRMNGGAILYGAARELLLNLTARSNHGPFELPTIDARMFIGQPKPQKEPSADPAP